MTPCLYVREETFINSFPRSSCLLFVILLNTNSFCTLQGSALVLSMFLCEHLEKRHKIYVLVGALSLLREGTVSECRRQSRIWLTEPKHIKIPISEKTRHWCWGWQFIASLCNTSSSHSDVLGFKYRVINRLFWKTMFVVLLGILFQRRLIDGNEGIAICGIRVGGGNRTTRKKTASVHFLHHRSHMTWSGPELKPQWETED